MQRQTFLTLPQLPGISLLTLAGLAVAGNKIEATILGENTRQTIANKSLTIDPAYINGSVCIKAIYRTSQGLIAKVEGVQKIGKDVSDVIGAIASMMAEQNLTYACFPAISNGSVDTFHVGQNSMNLMRIDSIADLQVLGDTVYYLQKSDQRQMKSTTIENMVGDSNWKKNSKVEYTFAKKVRSLGRINKDGMLPVALINDQMIHYMIKSKKPVYLEELMPNDAAYLGLFRLCDKVDHAVHLFVEKSRMIFMPEMATATN